MVHAALLFALKLPAWRGSARLAELRPAVHFQCGGQVFRVTGSASMRRVQALIAGPLKSPVTRPGLRLPMRCTNAT
jgi:hypothetical protein